MVVKNAFEISINYAEAINQANKLIKVSNKCDDIRSDLAKEIKFIENNWKGKSGDALLEKLKELQRKNKTVSQDLDQVANTIKRIANEIRQADADTSNIVRQLV